LLTCSWKIVDTSGCVSYVKGHAIESQLRNLCAIVKLLVATGMC
jgi:hypothetical protein